MAFARRILQRFKNITHLGTYAATVSALRNLA